MPEYTIPEVTDRDVYITRSFEAPVDVVWRFWTEPDLLAQWFGPHGISVATEDAQVELREGGPWNLVMRDDNGVYPIESTIVKMVEHEYLEMHMTADTGSGPVDNAVLRIQFHDHDHGDKTRITLHQGPFNDEQFRDMTRDGWGESFVKLDGALAAK